MRRICTTFLILVFFVTSAVPAFGQSTRYRLNTQAGVENGGLAPSFRGGRAPTRKPVTGDTQFFPGTSTQERFREEGVVGMGVGYQIHVLGEVINPGTYQIPASQRLMAAIQRAGGISENGSERWIELRRKGSKTRTIDLARFMLSGALEDNPYLMDNDVIFVPLRKTVVQIAGAVRRPLIYELKNEKNLFQVIDLSGGFNSAVARTEPIKVVRFVDGEKQVDEVPIEREAMKRFAVRGGDVVVVPNVVTKGTEFDYNVAAIPGDQVFYPSYEDRVFVLGGVSLPGAYPFSPYYTVNQYISLAGGLNDRGKEQYRIIDVRGKSHKAAENDRVNPGDTIMIKQRWMSPAGWMGFALGIASFGLSVSSTAIALSR